MNYRLKMKLNIFLLSFSLTLFVITQTASGALPKFDCQLEWMPMSVDQKEFPPFLVFATDKKIVVARTMPDNLFHTVGYVSMSDKIGHFPFQGQHKTSGIYEVATNPQNCTLLWTAANPSVKYSVKDSEADIHLIGRLARRKTHGVNLEVIYQSGPAFTLEGDIITDHMTDTAVNRRWEVLIAFTEGFRITINNFTFAENMNPHIQMDFVGMDIIENKSPTTVTQTVTHRKRITHSYHFEESFSYSHTWSAANYLTIILPFLYKGSGFESGGSSHQFEKKISKVSSVEVEVSRSVVVPPFTSVEVCSTVKIVEGYKTEYVAKAEYVVPGWDGVQVSAWLANDPDFEWEDSFQENGKTFRFVEGILDVDSLSTQTEFIVVPRDSSGCSNLKRKIEASRRLNRHKHVK